MIRFSTLTSLLGATPRPLLLLKAKAFKTQLVMVSGTFEVNEYCPTELKVNKQTRN